MKNLLAILFLFILARQASGQRIIERYIVQKDSLRIGYDKNDFLPYNDKGYTLVLPDSINNIDGVLISFEDRKFDLQGSSTQQIYHEAVAKQFAVLYVSTGVPFDLFFSTKSLVNADTAIKNVFTKYNLPNKNIFFLGVNLSGHRALKYVEFCKQNKSNFNPDIK